ncbi:hypothetical protein PI93_012995 [Pandoraea fibrosis]|uniref:Uncharacterized protein n=1 Tax=Pandoraea fibrosis TaxID=1891094 RepID=A0ABX6HSG9_9BURK|nr:hypothetical protein [Pandoraea fibrosis]QHE92988.1 hypothetical protein PJ20_015005 [Pandoraea fibrosis]QHF13454.1 hypothetical protein PI93_012995 [Pandoraea fibrosis]
MSIGSTSSSTPSTHVPQVSYTANAGASAQVQITMPEAPKDLTMGRWDEFQSAIQSHRGARNAALVGHLVNVIAKTTALAVAVNSMEHDWKDYADIPLHAISATVQVANLLIAVAKFARSSDIPGTEIRDTNLFETVGHWTGIESLKKYGGIANMAATNGPLVFGAVHNGAAPLLETLGIPVPTWLKDAANEDTSTAIVDGVAAATDFVQNKVLGTIIDGRDRRASVDQVVAAEARVNYVVIDGDNGYVHVEPRPTMEFVLEGVTVVPRVVTANPTPPADRSNNADINDAASLVSGDHDEFFDAESDTRTLVSEDSDDYQDALETLSRTESPRP